MAEHRRQEPKGHADHPREGWRASDPQLPLWPPPSGHPGALGLPDDGADA